MKFNRVREEFLIEQMGFKCTGCADKWVYTSRGLMTPWEYYGKLMEWAFTQKWFGQFVRDVIGEDNGIYGPLLWPIAQEYIDPERFAKALFKFMTGKES